MSNVVPIQLNPSTTGVCGRWKGEVGNILDSEYGVGNGLDRRRVDAVVDDVDKMLALDVPTPATQTRTIN